MRHRTNSTIVIAATLAVVLAGCGGDQEEPEVLPDAPASEQTTPPDTAQVTADESDEDTAAGTESGEDTAAGSASAEDTAEATAPGGEDGSTQTPAGLPTVPADYADALVVAWGAGDQDTMAQLGTEEVVHILGDGGGPNWQQTGAEGAAGSTMVTYQNTESGDVLTLRVDNTAASEGAEQAVVQAKFTTAGDEPGLPTQPTAYADALVVAWGSGDQDTMAQLGTEEVVHILGDGGGPNWQQIGAEGAAGSTMVTYQNSESGDVLTLRVDNAAASEGAEQAVVEARYETP